ncbi:UpxY family transcription antiterminator [Flavimarina sp. Hel_I_48]|uniref:UpxY family transcription antiterminator n=1 Tax=Flavimarina sp. Hel_I_48 TaxID=1392488 RepID=UPI000A7E3282|nr:UpxY family transcription antiterminator [Flavimarina sp. Hel_I_48]
MFWIYYKTPKTPNFMNWFVVYVKPKQEIKVCEQLSDLDVEAYAPCRKETRQWSDRKKQVDIPLFTSYVFVKLSEKERSLVFDVPGVVRYLFWLGKPAIVREKEIATLKDWLESDEIDDVAISQYKAGDRITINKGVLKGREAQIQKVGKATIRMILKELGVVVQVNVREFA